ncbi:MAG: ammonium transporter, partial [Gammaproteobacteria bacterium]|nr:ammonium transporter [Gammaproteobacteria bacterium]
VFGAAGGALVTLSVVCLDRLKIDDPVGAISVHGVCGLFGLLLVPLTNTEASLLGQLAGAATIFVWVFGLSWLVWRALKASIGIRIDAEHEFNGMDLADCGIEAYPEFTKTV